MPGELLVNVAGLTQEVTESRALLLLPFLMAFSQALFALFELSCVAPECARTFQLDDK